MDAFLFALNAVLPIVLIVALGYVLKRIGWIKKELAKALHKLVFHVFLPIMLFLNVYQIDDLGAMDFGYVLYAVVALLGIFFLALPCVLLFTREKIQRGALWQATFRSNYALIGIPLAQSLFGQEGAMVATLLSAVSVPALNILAVIALTVFRDGEEKPSVRKILLGIVKNPLIQSIALGLLTLGIRVLLVRWGISFRLTDLKPLYSVLTDLSRLATPLALLSLGAQFEFSTVATLKRQIVFGTVARTVAVPILGIGAAFLLFRNVFSGAHFAAFVAMFCTPVSVSSVPMAQEMDSDAVLAGQLVIFSTLVSAFTIFLCAFLLRLAGVFA